MESDWLEPLIVRAEMYGGQRRFGGRLLSRGGLLLSNDFNVSGRVDTEFPIDVKAGGVAFTRSSPEAGAFGAATTRQRRTSSGSYEISSHPPHPGGMAALRPMGCASLPLYRAQRSQKV